MTRPVILDITSLTLHDTGIGTIVHWEPSNLQRRVLRLSSDEKSLVEVPQQLWRETYGRKQEWRDIPLLRENADGSVVPDPAVHRMFY